MTDGPTQGKAALAPPPRPVPPLLRLYISVLYSLPGVLLLGFGLCLFTAFGVNSDWKAAAFFLPTASVQGTVTGLHSTYGGLGGSRNGSSGTTTVEAITYTFTAPGGASYRGVSYTSADDASHLDVSDAPNTPQGRAVPIQYVKEHPTLSRIHGLRTGVFEAFHVATVVFPLVGLLLLRGGLRAAQRTHMLLAEGSQDPATSKLYPPPGQKRPNDAAGGYEITSFMTGPPHIEGGQLYPPRLPRLLFVFSLLALMLLTTLSLLGQVVRHLGY